MNISYNEFHVSKKIRDLCNFNEGLFASSGNIVFANMKNVRDFAVLLNDVIKSQGNPEKQVSAAQLNAMGLIDEIFHQVCMLYRRDICPEFMTDLLNNLNQEYTKEEIDTLLLDFMKFFPPTEVYKGHLSPKEYLEKTAIDTGTGKERTNREQTLEEMILLHLANENPAFKPFAILFNDEELAENSLYKKTWLSINKYAETKPSFGPFNHDLINLLREPVLFAPDSLKGQLEYIQKHWIKILGEWLKKILMGIDSISEEEKAMWHGFGGGELPDMQPYSFENLVQEYERYSPDRDWMPKVVLMAKTVLVWLDQLTKQYGYPITRLDQIPDEELDKLRDEGFTGLWLIGLWERSNGSKRIKQLCGNPEAAASAYSLFDYNIASNIGGWDALSNLRQRLWQRGIRLASDMVPNHTGMDSDWVMNRPDLFVQRRDNPSPSYTFNGENLSRDPRTSIYLEDHYYSKNDCAVVFKRVDNYTGDTRYIYHGNDGTGLPWNDTAQIDYLNPEAREAVIQEILHVARNFPIIRFDAAMVLAKKSIRRLWYPEPGHGGDIYSRSEYSMSTQQFNDAIPNEFWREVVDRVAQEVPDTLLLAEAFWMMEGYFVRTLGMHRVYNSAFMNMLKKEENQKYRDTIKNTINFDPQILKRYVNFMNNPDEETAVAQFGDGDKYFGVCTLMITMPGLPMFGHGQIEGYTEKYGMEYTKAYKDEKPNQWLVDRHWREIFPLMKKRYLFANVENFLLYDLWENGHVNENVFAYSNGCGNERAVVFYNNKYERAAGWIKQSDPYAVKTGNGDEIRLETRSISEGLNLSAENEMYTIFRENRSGLWYIRHSREICEKGMFVALNGFEYQVLMDIQQIHDKPDHRYKILCDYLNGKGCEDIETAWQEIVYKELYEALNVLEEKLYKELTCLLLDDKKIDSKEVKTLLEDKKEYILDFFRISLKFVEDEELVISPEKQFEIFSKKVEKLIKIHNLKTPKKAADLYKVLSKTTDAETFVKQLVSEDDNLMLSLLNIAFCGSYAENEMAVKWNLGRKFNQFLKQENICEVDNRAMFTKVFVLCEKSTKIFALKTDKEKAFELISSITSGTTAYSLSGLNEFNGVKWFNKERTEESINLIFMILLSSLTKNDFESVLKLYKSIFAAEIKSEYNLSLFVKPFTPAKPKAKKSAVKTEKKKTSASASKAAPKKSEVKKKATSKSKKEKQ